MTRIPCGNIRQQTARYARNTGAALAALGLLAGCASGPNANPRDPLEPLNRSVSNFNEGVDKVLLKPVATAYREVTPGVVRTGVNNFFGNLGDAWSFVNSVLQLKGQNAAENFMRFSFNTVFGFAGVLDIASEMNIERHKEDFGQTLGRWGVPAGPYVVLPIFGPSTLRDTVALPVDTRGDIVRHVDHVPTRNSLYALWAVDKRATLLRASSVLDEAALDKYSFTRDVYLQLRRSEIYDGKDPADGKDPGDSTSPPAK
ncbi:MlaA family lipoprotein [Variovorax terrae]|uniref:VacJ family lipoprotein n=1 Tax=Variovorax terrae TaxID=2923278 RepID=A0A9X1VZN1_9BURK|nr:VacJ family lipoprotein [Variovorax terrae]MCJ0765002.1 VacJ family lipoprotein [Variovorax terrae]